VNHLQGKTLLVLKPIAKDSCYLKKKLYLIDINNEVATDRQTF